MPNWCMNEITITGSKEEMTRLYEAAETGDLLQAMVPHPEDMDMDSVEAYHWRLSNWGVKWDAEPDLELCHHDGYSTLFGFYSSPWGPAIEALSEYIRQHPDVGLVNHYFEGGMMFGGTYDSEYGHIEYNSLSIDTIPEELDQAFNITEMFEDA